MTRSDHTPRCECCRELARLRAASARGARRSNTARRSPCAVCGSTEHRNRRVYRGDLGGLVRLCPLHVDRGRVRDR